MTLDDFRLLHEKIKQGHGPRILSRFLPSATARTRQAWTHTEGPPIQWGSLPQVQARWNLLGTGDKDTTLYQHLSDTIWQGRNDITALSIGCGTGAHEVRFARTDSFARIDAFDLSPTRIAEAKTRATNEELTELLSFFEADARTFRPSPEAYDAVIAFNALHHVPNLDIVVPRLAAGLKRDGYLVLRDFVGPARFQWTDKQVAAVDGLLQEIPQRFRRRWRSGSIKTRVLRRGRLAMRLADPSEAVESDRILDVVGRFFEPVEYRHLGGTILHPLLADIAHNFVGDPESDEILHKLFVAEDELLEDSSLESDFVAAVFQKRRQGVE